MKEIVRDSTTWGNYCDVAFDIKEGKYSEDRGSSYKEVSEIYTKAENGDVLLTTGATTRNSANNIFDLAGNIYEWTSEGTLRGGFYFNYHTYFYADSLQQLLPASSRYTGGYNWCYDFDTGVVGFRVALYLK